MLATQLVAQRTTPRNMISIELAAAGVREVLLRDSFSVIDSDGDGLVAKGELLTEIASQEGFVGDLDTAAAMIEMNDTDGDGNLSFDEYVRFLSADPGFGPWSWLKE